MLERHARFSLDDIHIADTSRPLAFISPRRSRLFLGRHAYAPRRAAPATPFYWPRVTPYDNVAVMISSVACRHRLPIATPLLIFHPRRLFRRSQHEVLCHRFFAPADQRRLRAPCHRLACACRVSLGHGAASRGRYHAPFWRAVSHRLELLLLPIYLGHDAAFGAAILYTSCKAPPQGRADMLIFPRMTMPPSPR